MRPATIPAGRHQVDADLDAKVDAFFAHDTARTYRNLRALLVVVGGRTVLERREGGSTPATTYNVQSVGKSILATLIGIAAGEGQLRLDGTLGQLLPAYRPAMSRYVAVIPLRQLLTMTGGLPENFYQDVFRASVPPDVDWVRTILRAGQDQPAGRLPVLQRQLAPAGRRAAAGRRPAGARLRPRQAAHPAGHRHHRRAGHGRPPRPAPHLRRAGFVWPVDPQGVHLGSGGQKLTATDLAKLGRLWLQRGRWNGHQIVPASWLATATSRHITPPGGGFDYGYHFWTTTAAGHPAYAALGSGGQVIEVIPDLDLVAVIQSTSPSDPNNSTDTDTAPSERYVEMIHDPPPRLLPPFFCVAPCGVEIDFVEVWPQQPECEQVVVAEVWSRFPTKDEAPAPAGSGWKWHVYAVLRSHGSHVLGVERRVPQLGRRVEV